MDICNREDIYSFCYEQLKNIYPAGVPQEAADRLKSEMKNHLSSCEDKTIEQLILFHKLSVAAKHCGTMVTVCGTAYNSIFVYLLDEAHELNPLPAHYYCENCGYYESGFELTAGIDLSKKPCPECGNKLRRDGFSLYAPFAWGTNNSIDFEYRIASSFRNIANCVIHKHFRGCHVVMPLGEKIIKQDMVQCSREIGVALIPAPDFMSANFQGKSASNPIISNLIGYLKTGRPCSRADLSALEQDGIDHILFNDCTIIDTLNRLQEITGVFYEDISLDECSLLSARDVINTGLISGEAEFVLEEYRPTAFASLAAYAVSIHNTILSESDDPLFGIEACRKILTFEYPTFTREDAYEFLLCWIEPEALAYNAAQKVYMGDITGKNAKELLRDCPADFQEQAPKTRYLFPRAHAFWYMKQWLRLAWYLKEYPQQYSEAVWSQ